MTPWQKFLGLFQRKSVTPGQLLPPWRRGQPQWPTWDGKKAIKEGLKLSTVVYACNKLRSECLASLPWYVETLQGASSSAPKAYGVKKTQEWERSPGDPLETLLEYPNDYQSRQTVFQTIALQMDLVGNALMTKIMVTDIREGGKVPGELWIIDPTNVQPIPDSKPFITGYQYIDGDRRIIPAEGVIHFQHVDPSNPYWGLSPLQAASRSVDTAVEAIRWNKNSLANRAMPEGLFSFERQLNEVEWEQARDWIAQAYASPDNARVPIVLGEGASFEVINWKPLEMDFVNSMAMYREDICMVFGVPPTMIGIMEKATDANVENYEAAFWRNTMIPFADQVKSTLIRGLLTKEQRATRRLCYDLSGVKVLQEDREKQVNQYAKLVQWGVPVNAAIKLLGLDTEDVEGGDVGLVPATQVPLTHITEVADQQIRMGDATIDNTEASTETTLKPPKDPNKPKPAAPAKDVEPEELKAIPAAPAVDVRVVTGPEAPPVPTHKSMRVRPIRSPAGTIMEYEVEQDITYTDPTTPPKAA